MKRVLVLEETEIWREILKLCLSRDPSLQVLGPEELDVRKLRERVEEVKPDLLVLGTRELRDDVLEAVEEEKAGIILLFSRLTETGISKLKKMMRKSGKLACILKESLNSCEELLDLVKAVFAGYVEFKHDLLHLLLRDEGRLLEELSSREREILKLMAEGYRNKAIADILNLEVKTVEHYVNSIFSKLGLGHSELYHPRVKAILMYLEMEGKLLPFEAPASSTCL